MHQVAHSTEGAIVFTVAKKSFVTVVLLPNPGAGAFFFFFFFFIVHTFLFNLTCDYSCIPEFTAQRVSFFKNAMFTHDIYAKPEANTLSSKSLMRKR